MISVTILRMASLKPSSHKLTTLDCSGFEDLVKAIAKAFDWLHNLVRKKTIFQLKLTDLVFFHFMVKHMMNCITSWLFYTKIKKLKQ